MAPISIIERAARAAIKPKDRLNPWQWSEKWIIVDKTSPMPGPWKSANSPWCRQPMEEIGNNDREQVACMFSAQSAKTQMIINCNGYIIAEDPGPAMYVMAAQDEAKTFARTRLMPTLESAKPVADLFPSNRHEKTTLEINFVTMPLILNGANSQSKLQSKPVRWLFLDEVRNYPPGALEMVRKRTTTFWNSRTVIISTADMAGDPVHEAYLQGDQREWFFDCPKCGQAQVLKWAQMKWDNNDTTRPGGKWNFNELEKTVRYECFACGHPINDTPTERRHLCDTGRWVSQNPNAPHTKVSFHINAMLPPWIRWKKLVEEFVIAVEIGRRGDIMPLKSFINERLGEPWNDQHQYVEVERPPETAYSFEEVAAQKFDAILLTGDVQLACIWVIIRGWYTNGSSRLIWCGKAATLAEVNEIEKTWKVQSKLVMIDSGYRTQEVYEACATFGWTALKGEDKPYFVHHINKKNVRKIYSPLVGADLGKSIPGIGRPKVPLILWSNPAAKDILKRLRDGLGASHEIPRDVPDFYLQQMASEAKVPEINVRTGREQWVWKTLNRNNHLWDCECEQIVGASMLGFIGPVVTVDSPQDSSGGAEGSSSGP